MSIERLSGGLTPADGSDPRTFPEIFNGFADAIEQRPISGNAIINGDFGVWQRGTTFSGVSGDLYNADRWFTARLDGATITRQSFTPADIEAIGYGDAQFYLRVAGLGDTNQQIIGQRVEDVRTLAGQQVTISFYARSDTAKTYRVRLRQNFGNGGSALVDFTSDVSVGTGWQRFTVTDTLPSLFGKTIGDNSFLSLEIRHEPAEAFTLDLWGVQLEAGPVATPFRLAGGGRQAAELALCQRYYFRQASPNFASYAFGYILFSNLAVAIFNLPSNMRSSPSISFNNLQVKFDGSSETPVNNISLTSSFESGNATGLTLSTDPILTPGGVVFMRASDSGAFLEMSAEL